MGKLRVQDVAKELGVTVKKIREVLKEWGIEKGNFAYLDEEELQIVYDNLLHSKDKPVDSVSIQEVAKGFECGIKLKDYNDIKVGDIIVCYVVKLEKPQ